MRILGTDRSWTAPASAREVDQPRKPNDFCFHLSAEPPPSLHCWVIRTQEAVGNQKQDQQDR